MLSRMTRVFFGFPAEDVDKDTTIGHIDIRFQNNLRRNCTLSYSNNGMDKLNLPIPGQDGPERYDNEILLFEKLADGTFSLSIATAQEADLSRRSLEIDALYHMRGGRPWGVF